MGPFAEGDTEGEPTNIHVSTYTACVEDVVPWPMSPFAPPSLPPPVRPPAQLLRTNLATDADWLFIISAIALGAVLLFIAWDRCCSGATQKKARASVLIEEKVVTT